MKNSYKLVIFFFITSLFSTGAAHATARLGDWELLFDKDDGRAVALDVHRETPVILDAKGGIYYLNKEVGGERKGEWFGDVYESWQKVSGSGYGMDISLDGDGIPWVVELNTHRVLHLDGNIYDPHGWIEHPGNAKAKKISVSKKTGAPFIIGANSGHIFQGTDKGWKRLPTTLVDANGKPAAAPLNAIDVYVDSHDSRYADKPTHSRIYVINQDKRVYQYDIHAPSDAWKEMKGGARAEKIASSRGLTYIIGEDKKFYGFHYPDDKEWMIAGPGSGKDLAYSEAGIFQPFVGSGTSKLRYLWTVGEKGRVFRAFIAH
ncbi:MAG TPA: hypothetical protein DDW55_13990 [Gammaproteobacteria bacterium]|nr:hypothetical protein [Gammaproteobacteria bacterium]